MAAPARIYLVEKAIIKSSTKKKKNNKKKKQKTKKNKKKKKTRTFFAIWLQIDDLLLANIAGLYVDQ
jgi:hypothetical protein